MKILKIILHSLLITILPVIMIMDVKALPGKPGNGDIIKIGLLIQDNKSSAALHGAEMAIQKGNKNVSSDGKSFRLIAQSMEGPWGTGSTKTVELIFNDKVMAILGSHDGKNAHLVEQVSAKARIVFLSAWASDPTLTQAYIPWCYNCVPNDLQQAEAIVNEVYLKRKYKQVAVITDKGYDSKMSLNSLIKKAKIAGETDPLQFFCDIRSYDINLLSDQIMNSGINCIVVYGSGGNSGKIIEQLNQKKLNQEIFSSISMLNDSGPSNLRLKNLERTVFISSGHWFTPDGLLFSREFEQKYGYIPGPVAAYAYDGMNLIIEAIRKAGYESEKIREVMSKIKYKGVTGWIEFDSMGNRSWKGEFITIKDGRLVVAK